MAAPRQMPCHRCHISEKRSPLIKKVVKPLIICRRRLLLFRRFPFLITASDTTVFDSTVFNSPHLIDFHFDRVLSVSETAPHSFRLCKKVQTICKLLSGAQTWGNPCHGVQNCKAASAALQFVTSFALGRREVGPVRELTSSRDPARLLPRLPAQKFARTGPKICKLLFSCGIAHDFANREGEQCPLCGSAKNDLFA